MCGGGRKREKEGEETKETKRTRRKRDQVEEKGKPRDKKKRDMGLETIIRSTVKKKKT